MPSAHALWLGVTDEIREGIWVWVTGESWNFADWIDGEPNNCSRPEFDGGTDCVPEHYLTIMPPDGWDDSQRIRTHLSVNGILSLHETGIHTYFRITQDRMGWHDAYGY